MRKAELITGICLIVIFVISFQLVRTNEGENKQARELYNQYCASCHGVQLDRFAGREWIFGSSIEEMSSTIKNGRPSIGMPAFAKAMNDQEIRVLSNFVLNELPHMNRKILEGEPSDQEIFNSKHLSFKLEEVLGGMGILWGMAFLPNGNMLVTDKSGILIRMDGKKKHFVDGVPKVMNQGQGGLLDVAVHPDFIKNNYIYLAFSEGNASSGGNTTIIRAELRNDQLLNIKKIFHATPNSTTGLHFGCRIVFDNDGFMFFSVGERGKKENAQDLSNHSGKIHRLYDDGRIPPDNPFVNKKGAQGSIWSYGHRNPQSLFFDKENDILWENEHGPKGGDEVNIIKKGKNYGWPLVTFGVDYDGTIISNDTSKAGLEPPVFYWIPSIAPSGMIIVKGNRYKNWKGSILTGSLSFKFLERLEMKGNKVVGKEKLISNIGRVRNVVEGPDGSIYVSVEKPGRIYKIVPVE